MTFTGVSQEKAGRAGQTGQDWLVCIFWGSGSSSCADRGIASWGAERGQVEDPLVCISKDPQSGPYVTSLSQSLPNRKVSICLFIKMPNIIVSGRATIGCNILFIYTCTFSAYIPQSTFFDENVLPFSTCLGFKITLGTQTLGAVLRVTYCAFNICFLGQSLQVWMAFKKYV